MPESLVGMSLGFRLGDGSKARLVGLHPKLVQVVEEAITLSTVDFTVVEGLRSKVQCYINFGKGRTEAQCALAGCPPEYARPRDAKVTWLNHPLSSNHAAHKDGLGRAVDLYPYPISRVLSGQPKDYLPLFDDIALAMAKAANQLQVRIRWGGNWDRDGKPHEKGETDNPHFELVGL